MGRVEQEASQGLGKSVSLIWARVLWDEGHWLVQGLPLALRMAILGVLPSEEGLWRFWILRQLPSSS